MRKRETAISDAALDVLRRSTCDGTVLTLPPGQLEWHLYQEVNEALVRLGGKWKRGKGHIFTADPRPALAAMLNAGAMPAKNVLDFFATPRPIVDRMLAALANTMGPELDGDGIRILEPSAGSGAILDAVRDWWPNAQLQPVEIDEGRCAELRAKGYDVLQHDFLLTSLETEYDAVVMNPPFTAPDNARAYLAHIRKAWSHVKPGGCLVAIAPAGLQFQTVRQVADARTWIEANDGTIEDLPAGCFDESGTGVNTVMVTMQRPAQVPACEASEALDLFAGVGTED